jgi:hypothetical protein
MTNDQLQSIRDDIAYVSALAQEGRRTPLLGGAILVAAGVIFGIASLLHWAILSRVLALGPTALNVMWFCAVALFLGALFVLKARLSGRPGARSATNRASGAAWAGMGGAAFAIAAALFIAVWKTGDWIFMGLFPPVILALYGAAWAVSAAMADRRWLNGVALGSFAAAIASAWLIGSASQYLIYAAALFLLAAVPGLALMREEPTDVV